MRFLRLRATTPPRTTPRGPASGLATALIRLGRRCLPLVCVALVMPLAGRAQVSDREEILSFDVTIVMGAGGSMRVTEEIRVRALGDEIQRGIYRDFPTSFPSPSGLGRVVAPFEVVEVLRDGSPEAYTLLSVGGPARRSGIRIRIGRADTLLEPGEYTYRLTYETSRWVEFGDQEDLLYWNVTGNGWGFPILSASASIIVPGAVPPSAVSLQAWTGPEGATDTDATAAVVPLEGEGVAASFTTTEVLAPGEGLTVRVTLPSGVLAPPTDAQREQWFRMDWGSWVDAGLVVALVVAFYLFMWRRVGVDPPAGPVVARYEPPEGFSAAALGYLRERGYDDRQLTAAVVSLAVKGALTIEREKSSTWTLRRTVGARDGDPSPGPSGPTREAGAPLTRDETTLLEGLFAGSDTVTLAGTSSPRVRSSVKALRGRLAAQLERHYFLTNRRWFAVGVLVTLLAFAALTWRARFGIAEEGWFLGLWLSFWSIGTGTLLWRVVSAWGQARAGGVGAWAGALFLTLFSIPFVGAEIVVGYLLWGMVPPHLLATAVVLGATNAAFYHLLERPTLKGRGVLDALDGFRRFLLATDEHRFDRMQPAGASLELFERFLPHAIALDAENAWAERFEGALTAPDASTRAPGWYVGGSYGRSGGGFSASGLTSSLGRGMASSLSASSAAPASSGGGGGGGGGSSGGGGGGGGGGGW